MILDEWGQGCDELTNSPDPAEREAAAATGRSADKRPPEGRDVTLPTQPENGAHGAPTPSLTPPSEPLYPGRMVDPN